MAKTGANEPCTCGSGKKYKKCCRDKGEAASRRLILTPDRSNGIAEFVRKTQLDREKSKYDAPKYHEFELGGQKFRIVGRGVYPQPHSGQLSDIIIEHLKTQVLGQKWLEVEAQKAPEEQHIVIRWLNTWTEMRQGGLLLAQNSRRRKFQL